MKLLIAVDMEGITGVTNWDQVTPCHAEYSRFRERMTADVNAAIAGALGAGANEVLVADGHWYGTNIMIEDLPGCARLNAGSPSPFSMMQGLDENVSGVFFIGYHARQGSQNAVLDHTWSPTCVANLWLNDLLAGEYTLNAALAGHFHVPILMVSGDQTACAQMLEQFGKIETAVVKQATGRFAAECLSPESTAKLIHDAALRAVTRYKNKDHPKPFILGRPIHLTIQFVSSDMADRAMLMPGIKRDGLKISFTARDMPEVYSAFQGLAQMVHPE